MKRILCIVCCAALLTACGEVNQTSASGSANRGDNPPWQGAKDEFVAKGWAPGSRNAWETQMRTRVATQNEYLRVN